MSEPKLSDNERRVLLDIASGAVAAAAERRALTYTDAAFPKLASFVTLYVDEQLRGCLGSLIATGDLGRDVASNAYRAASEDPRFERITAGELGSLRLHVSVLGPLEELDVDNYDSLAERIAPGDGLLISSRLGRATFLPTVWEKLPGVDDFLLRLWLKARLRHGVWPDDMQAYRYRTIEFTSD